MTDVPADLSLAAAYGVGFLTDTHLPLVELADGVSEQTVTLSIGRMGLHPSSHRVGYRVEDPVTGEIWFLEYRAATFGGATPFWMNEGSGIVFDDGRVLEVGPGIRAVRAGDGRSTVALARQTEPGVWSAAWDVGETLVSPTESLEWAFVSGSPGSGAVVELTLRRDANAASATPVYRFWSSTKRAHFFTADLAERDFVIAAYDDDEWLYEGEAYRAFPSAVGGAQPLYRFWSARYQGHFYTADLAERDFVIAAYPDDEWLYEGVAYYVYPSGVDVPGAIGVARFWSAEFRHHFYTADAAEREAVIELYPDNVWRYEGFAFEVPGG